MNPDAIQSVDRVPHGGTTDSDVIDFSANINPERPPGVEAAYTQAWESIGQYPDDTYSAFRQAVASNLGIDPAWVVPTAGGMGALRLALETTLSPGAEVLVPEPGFGEYAREIQLNGATPRPVSAATILSAAPQDATAAIVCTPNNPTGRSYNRAALRGFIDRCREAGTTVIIDEAFLGFTDRDSLAGTPGTIVLRSLTKLFGIPGLRIGYAVARGETLDRLQRAREPWTLSGPAAAVGTHCLNQQAFINRTNTRVAEERRRLQTALAERFTVGPTGAPFLLVDLGDHSVDRLLTQTREQGLILRDARTFAGLDSHVRIAIKRPAEHDRLLAALAAFS